MYERIAENVVQNTGVTDTLFDHIKLEVSKVIDQTAYEKMYEYPQFEETGQTFQYSKIEQSALFRSARTELVEFANQVLQLYRPLAIWILVNPEIKPTKLTPNPSAVDTKERLVSKAGQISDEAAAKGSRIWNNIKTGIQKFFSKAGPAIMHSIRKRSDQTVVQKHVDNLIREHYYYQVQSPPLSMKDKLMYGWQIVIRDVSSLNSNSLTKRDIMKRSLRVFAQRLIDALRKALTARSVYESLLRKFF